MSQTNNKEALSEDDVKTIVARALPTEGSIRVLSHKLASHSQIRVGFLGEHQNLLVDLNLGDDSQVSRHGFFIKSVPDVSVEQSMFINRLGLFNREADYFNKLLPELRRDFSGPDWCPGCYLANSRVIVLEDMRTRGYGMSDEKIFDRVHLSAAVKAQARLHASSIVYEARTSRPASEICPRACKEVVFVETDRYRIYRGLIEGIATQLNLDNTRVGPGLRWGMARLYDPDNPGRRVISHGDSWPNNYLFKANAVDCVMVDYQLVRYAPRMHDVAQLIYFSTTRKMREDLEHEIIEAYHQELCKILDRNDLESEKPSLELLLQEYEDAKSTALLAATVYYPIILMTKNMLIEHEDPDVIFQKIFFRANNDFVMELYERHPEYAERLNELAREIVEYFDKFPKDELNCSL